MRIAGYLDKENDARLLSDYLHSKGLLNEVEPTQSGTWTLWIHDDKQLEEGRQELERFLAAPENPIYRENAPKGREFLARRKREDQRFHERTVDVRTSWVGMHQGSVGFLTALLMGVSVIVYLFGWVGENEAVYNLLRIDSGRSGEVLGDVRRGGRNDWRRDLGRDELAVELALGGEENPGDGQQRNADDAGDDKSHPHQKRFQDQPSYTIC